VKHVKNENKLKPLFKVKTLFLLDAILPRRGPITRAMARRLHED